MGSRPKIRLVSLSPRNLWREDQMLKRIALAMFAAALIATPVGFAFAQATDSDEPADVVPASSCPASAQAVEDAGYPSPDTFYPTCPEPSEIQPATSEIPVSDLAEDCQLYEQKPAWCPTDDELAAAGGEN
jgi:hypothetical protein